MALYQNVNGVWTPCQRPYVKRNGVWTAVNEAWVKRSGTWVRAYEYDVTPPSPPTISLEVVEDYDTIKGVKTLKTRYIKVGVRLPNATNDPDARLVRVLTTYNGKPPTTQTGGTYTPTPDHTYPDEPWSEWRYNDYGQHQDTSVVKYKQWPPNAGAGDTVKSDETYYFTGWSLDDAANWSSATAAQIHIPKASVSVPNIITKQARIQPNNSGSWRTTTGWRSGVLLQQKSPSSYGLWLYGNQISDTFHPASVTTIKNAQIFIHRTQDDTGPANANMYLYRTTYGTVASLPDPAAPGGIGRQEATKIGTLAKGQGKWFDLPASFWNNLNGGIKGMGLSNQDPAKADAQPADFSTISATATNQHCGELYVVWEETL